MRRLFVFMLVVILSLCSGCAGEQGGQYNAPPGESPQNKENAEQTAKAEITEAALNSWKNSIGTVWAHGAVEIKNTGSTPINIGNITVSFVDADKMILGTASMLLAVPETLKPGETAYAGDSTVLDGVADPKAVVSIEANIDYSVSNNEAQLLEVQDLKIVDQDYGGVKVTGRVKNTSANTADDIRICIALFDQEDKLLGVLEESPHVALEPEGSLGFETSYPEIDIKASRVKSMIGKSYNWKFDFD